MISCSFRVRRVMISVVSVAGAAPLLALRCEMDPSSSFLLPSHMNGGAVVNERPRPNVRRRLGESLASACYSFFPCFVAPSPRSFAASSSLRPSLPRSVYPLPLFLPSAPSLSYVDCGRTGGGKERKKEGRMEGRRECATYVSCPCPLRSGKREGREEETQTD